MTSIPQYARILDLVFTTSSKYAERMKRIFVDAGRDWDDELAQAEMDAFFCFIVSCEMRRHEQGREVSDTLFNCYENEFIERHGGGGRDSQVMRDFLEARVTSYGDATNNCIRRGEEGSLWQVWLDVLVDHFLNATLCSRRLETNPGFYVVDGIQMFQIKSQAIYLQVSVVGLLQCALKHVFQATRDIRSLEVRKLEEHIVAGIEESTRFTSKLSHQNAGKNISKNRGCCTLVVLAGITVCGATWLLLRFVL